MNSSSEDCVYTVWAGPSVGRAYGSTVLYSHYSLLATLEKAWNLAPLTLNDSRSTPMTEFFQRQYSPPSKSPDNRPLIITALLALGLVVLTILVVSRGRRKNPRQSWYLLEPPYCQFMSPAFSRGVNLYPPLLGARPTISLYTLGYLLLSVYCRELRPGMYRNSNILRPGTSFLSSGSDSDAEDNIVYN